MRENMLVVVDYQNDFVDGSLGFEGAQKLDEGIAKLVETYQKNGGTVIVTKDTHKKDYLDTREGKNLPIPHCIKEEFGWQLYGKTASVIETYKNNIYFIEKESFGVAPKQMLCLQEKFNPQKIQMVGLVSNICVLSNVCCFQAAFPMAEIQVIKEYTSSFNQELHEKTMDVLKGIQVEVIE